MDFGKVLRDFRKAFKWSQQTLTEKTRISQPRLSRIENNETPADIKEITVFAQVFCVTEGELVDGKINRALRNARAKRREERKHGKQSNDVPH